jgi:hypothetical protein
MRAQCVRRGSGLKMTSILIARPAQSRQNYFGSLRSAVNPMLRHFDAGGFISSRMADSIAAMAPCSVNATGSRLRSRQG